MKLGVQLQLARASPVYVPPSTVLSKSAQRGGGESFLYSFSCEACNYASTVAPVSTVYNFRCEACNYAVTVAPVATVSQLDSPSESYEHIILQVPPADADKNTPRERKVLFEVNGVIEPGEVMVGELHQSNNTGLGR